MSDKKFRQPSVMGSQHAFSRVPSANVNMSTFDRSHAVKTTFDAGKLIPIFVDEVLPGDTFRMTTTTLARLATPLKPLMDNMYMDVHYFFVPNRLVWEDWQKFMGERPTPDFDPSTLSMPQRQLSIPNDNQPPTADDFKVSHYYGLPYVSEADSTLEVCALPFRAYQLIWNEWYRDQNLQNPVDINITGDPDVGDVDLLPRNKRFDYFTSSLPWPQKGDAVLIPLGDDAPIFFTGDNQDDVRLPDADGNIGALHETGASSVDPIQWRDGEGTGNATLLANLREASALPINDLRTAFQIQKMLERDARGGTRYIELILSHFGVVSDDARLQRPEYLGGTSQRININPVASTASVDDAPQANLAAFGTGSSQAGFKKSFTEHGFIIGLASVRADLTYQRGVERMWSRKTRYDHYWPSLAHLGEQAVANKELWYNGDAEDDEVFGYQERFAEYRYKPSRITGLFNSDCAQSLDIWHLAQDFEERPVLNDVFIRENPPIDRVIAVPSEPHFICDIWHRLKTTRPMPIYSVPGLIDHF